tara:strand:+ start:192 stop:461 length:270 start_codon:yes stop_codon:yes gene_type:complete
MKPTQLYINGQYCDATSNETFANYNPATGELLAIIQSASLSDVDKAVTAAKHGFVMADANATVEPLQGRLTRPLERTTIGMCMGLKLKK